MAFTSRLVRAMTTGSLVLSGCGGKPLVPEQPLPSSLVTDIVVTTENGAPLVGASYGWFAESGPDFNGTPTSCCTDERGRFSVSNEYLPPTGDISVYAVEARPGDQYGIVRLDRSSSKPLQPRVHGTLRLLRGRVVDTTGEPLAAVVYLARSRGELSAIDRVLAQPPETDTDGSFAYRVTSPGPFDLHVATWDHVDDS